jgi:hypothetical protein
MSTKTRLACAALLLAASSAPVLAEEYRIDTSSDHVYYYGPVPQEHHVSAATEHRQTNRIAVETPRLDTSADHMYYYGPVK